MVISAVVDNADLTEMPVMENDQVSLGKASGTAVQDEVSIFTHSSAYRISAEG